MMPEINQVSQPDAGKHVADVVQAYIDDLRQSFPSAEYVLGEPGYGDEDVVVRISGAPGELNALSNAAAQLSAAVDQRSNLFILPPVNPWPTVPCTPGHRRGPTCGPAHLLPSLETCSWAILARSLSASHSNSTVTPTQKSS
jgi:hypothetical protein